MDISINFGAYLWRKFRKPWIAKVTDWPHGQKPKQVWGMYIGDESGGELEIAAEVGDIIRWGKSHYSHPWKNICYWAIAREGGELEKVTVSVARKAWRAREKEKGRHVEVVASKSCKSIPIIFI